MNGQNCLIIIMVDLDIDEKNVVSRRYIHIYLTRICNMEGGYKLMWHMFILDKLFVLNVSIIQ